MGEDPFLKEVFFPLTPNFQELFYWESFIVLNSSLDRCFIEFYANGKIISSPTIPRLSVEEDIILPNIIKMIFVRKSTEIIHFSLFISEATSLFINFK